MVSTACTLVRRRMQSCDEVHPLFVVGVGRSGTTPLCQALHCHPQIIMAPGESPLVHHVGLLARSYESGGEYYWNSTGIPYEAVRDQLRSLCVIAMWGDSEETMSDRLAAVRMAPAAEKDFEAIRCWGGKVFPDEPSARGLHWLFGRATFVHIVRNGIDVVHSMSKFHGFRHLTFEERCRFWSNNVLRYQWLRSYGRGLEIRFEDFLRNPDACLRRVFSLARLLYDGEPSRFAASTLVHPLDQATMAANPCSTLAQRRPAHENWSTGEREMFREICSEAMHVFRYELPF